MTVAELGLKITAHGVNETRLNLEKLVKTSGDTEKATVKMSAETTKAFKQMGTGSQTLEVMNRSLDRTERELKMVGAAAAGIPMVPLTREFGRVAPLADTATEALKRNTRALNENRAARNTIQTSNVAAQFQDIGVSAAMGMSPTMIALQQGTQLSAALGGQGLRGTVSALGAAFASVLSPVSLLTIATIGLGTAGVQALMSMMNSTDKASDALERHSTWLDKILAGYDSARDAAEKAAGAAMKLPQQAVESNLDAELARNQDNFRAKIEETTKAQQELNYYTQRWIEQRAESARKFPDDERALARFDGLITVAQNLTDLEITTRSTRAEIDQFISRATELFNAAQDPAVKQQAADMVALGEAMLTARGQVEGTTAAIAELKAQSPINIAINVATDQATAAIQELINMRPELRTPGQVARDDAAANLSIGRSAPDAILRMKAEAEYAKTIAALDEADRRAAAERASRAGGKSFDQWGSATSQMQQRIDGVRLEMQLMGQSTYEVERQKAAFDLLNQAKQAGIPITSSVTDQINTMSSQYATATTLLEQYTEAQREWEQNINFAKGTVTGFLGDLRAGMSDGVLGWDDWANAGVNALNRIADRAMTMAVDGIFDMIFGTAFGGAGGSMGANSQTLPWRAA